VFLQTSYEETSDLCFADAMCNYIGNERWVEELETSFHGEFVTAKSVPWVTKSEGRQAGEVRSAGGGGFTAGNVTFVNVYGAGYGLISPKIIVVRY